MPLLSAYLLVSHGSRDPRPQAALEQLAELLTARLEHFSGVQKSGSVRCRAHQVVVASLPLVGTACLELATLPLHQQIIEFGKQAVAVGFRHLQVLPLFLLPGMHVMEDIPAEVALAQKALGSNLKIHLRPHIGTHPNLGRLLVTNGADAPADARILLSHGTRRSGGNQSVEAVADQLNAVPAYWSISPSLEERVQELVNAAIGKIEIIPYFLFAGGITDAIAQEVEQLQQQFPAVQLSLAEPIGASAFLADLIWELTVDGEIGAGE